MRSIYCIWAYGRAFILSTLVLVILSVFASFQLISLFIPAGMSPYNYMNFPPYVASHLLVLLLIVAASFYLARWSYWWVWARLNSSEKRTSQNYLILRMVVEAALAYPVIVVLEYMLEVFLGDDVVGQHRLFIGVLAALVVGGLGLAFLFYRKKNLAPEFDSGRKALRLAMLIACLGAFIVPQYAYSGFVMAKQPGPGLDRPLGYRGPELPADARDIEIVQTDIEEPMLAMCFTAPPEEIVDWLRQRQIVLQPGLAHLDEWPRFGLRFMYELDSIASPQSAIYPFYSPRYSQDKQCIYPCVVLDESRHRVTLWCLGTQQVE